MTVFGTISESTRSVSRNEVVWMIALYVGAGCDVRPLRTLPSTTQFVYVDGQPFSEFGTTRCPNGFGCECTHYDTGAFFTRVPGFCAVGRVHATRW